MIWVIVLGMLIAVELLLGTELIRLDRIARRAETREDR